MSISRSWTSGFRRIFIANPRRFSRSLSSTLPNKPSLDDLDELFKSAQRVGDRVRAPEARSLTFGENLLQSRSSLLALAASVMLVIAAWRLSNLRGEMQDAEQAWRDAERRRAADAADARQRLHKAVHAGIINAASELQLRPAQCQRLALAVDESFAAAHVDQPQSSASADLPSAVETTVAVAASLPPPLDSKKGRFF
eukprot:TRINITY_DN11885_c0_g1_i1.p1 TRINITY_DN11885_c0_g1~~TRINITY_DN11885_c0_g1_i1.p1  ORF type:complete len:218 (+),score=14.96 TRINITY_DN11885_c0_g1_i1:61-654(+)